MYGDDDELDEMLQAGERAHGYALRHRVRCETTGILWGIILAVVSAVRKILILTQHIR